MVSWDSHADLEQRIGNRFIDAGLERTRLCINASQMSSNLSLEPQNLGRCHCSSATEGSGVVHPYLLR